MNLELLESFGQNFPEDFDGILDCVSVAITCSFNRRGALLAVGCNDGRIAIWDFLTRGIAKVISAHVHPVCSLSWSRNGKKLLSACTDNTVSVWDVLSGECDHVFRFPSPILKVQFHPRNNYQFIVCPMKHATILMDVNGEHAIVPLDDEADQNVVAAFDRRGEYIYTGNSRGRILIFRTTDLELIASFRLAHNAAGTAVKQLEFARRSECFLVNAADRVIRVYESREILACGKDGDPQPIQKLQDLVNKTMWKKCCFSGDGEYIATGSARQHSIYIWEKNSGATVKDLHGTKGEMLLDLLWHPIRPIICSISSGVVSVWSQNQVENWSAFAPDFKELDENVEYDERESEFDVEDEDKDKELSEPSDIEEVLDVDVTTVEQIQSLLSSDEEPDNYVNELIFLPVAPEIEEPEESPFATNKVSEQVSPNVESTQSKGEPEIKKKKIKVTNIALEGVPVGENHPLLNVKKGSSSSLSSIGSMSNRGNNTNTFAKNTNTNGNARAKGTVSSRTKTKSLKYRDMEL